MKPNKKQKYYLIKSVFPLLQGKRPENIQEITSTLYPTVAKMYNTAPGRVERAIRHAIESTWIKGNMEAINKIFGNTMNYKLSRPTNSEFIALIADNLMLEMEKDERNFA